MPSLTRSYWFVFFLIGSLTLVCALALPFQHTRAGGPIKKLPDEKLPAYVPGELLVRFRTPAQARRAESNLHTLTTDRGNVPVQIVDLAADAVPGLRLAQVAAPDTLAAWAALNKRPDVLYAELNYVRHKFTLPNDTRFSELWGLKNTGQQGGTSGADISAEQAWNTTTGSRSVVVGIVDEGIDINHPDLAANVWVNPGETPNNGVDDDGNGYVDDVNGWDFFHNDKTVYDGTGGDGVTDAHGTHVAGTVGAAGNNGLGVTGVNWQVSLMSLKILGRDNESPAPSSVLQTVRAYAYAKQMRELWQSSGGTRGANLRILNNSYGGPGRSQAEFDAINALNSAGILFIVAAGNESADTDQVAVYPANYDAPNLISVMASNRNDSFVAFSNYGLRTVHLAAPGVEILSTTPNGTYTLADGTSAAAPQVAGVAALLLATQPNATLARLRAALLYSGDAKNYSCITRRRLNAAAALTNLAENDTTAPAAPADFRLASQNNSAVTLAWTPPGDDGTGGGAAAVYELRFAENDLSNPAEFERATVLVAPSFVSGTSVSFDTSVPFRHRNGYFGLRAIDNAGNAGPIAKVAVTVPLNAADPYVMLTGPAEALSTGGTALNVRGDDVYRPDVQLPFTFPFHNNLGLDRVSLSSNGGLYLFNYPGADGEANDAGSWVTGLHRRIMIAGLWDDLRTDRRAGDDVYLVQPDANRVIFRWQAVTFNSVLDNGQGRGENPVNFEIELRRDGTIIERYGAGNQNVFPVVGLSRGVPDAYVAVTHTSENAPTNLTNAPTITYALRNPPAAPAADVGVSMIANPNPVLSGRNITYSIAISNNGPSSLSEATLTDTLPAGLTFVSCTVGTGTCTGPAVGSNGTVTAHFTTFFPNQVTIVAQASGSSGTVISNTATVSSPLTDGNPSNNSITAVTSVAQGGTLGGVRAVAAGRGHSVALLNSGAVLTWGWNAAGQLGDGSTSDRPTPAPVSGLPSVTAVAAGAVHTLAVAADGTVWGWGVNSVGQLGDGSTTERHTPVQAQGLSGVTALAAGNFFSAALKSDGTVWAWGDSGLTGDGTNTRRTSPVQVQGLSNVTAISARGDHTLALKSDGTIWAWGFNNEGELGDGTTQPRNAPVQVINLTNVASIAAGGGSDNHSIAVKQDGTVWGWGFNFKYQIGQPQADFTPHPTPLLISGTTGGTAVAGDAHSLLVKSDGTVWGWGDNNNLQLGSNGPSCCRPTPLQLAGVANVATVAAGDAHNLALLTDGTVRTWGYNSYGQLGDGSTTPHADPQNVSGTPSALTPVLTPAPGNYATGQNITVTCSDPGAVVRYTNDVINDPTDSSPVVPCGTTFRAEHSLTLKVRAWKPGLFPSGVAGGQYIIASSNNIDRPDYFVRQHYLDFLGREPDTAGQNYWTNEITRCALDRNCVHARRIGVSAAFFIEAEFQDTGYYVYRMYRASLGRRPTYGEFTADRELVVGGTSLELLRQAFANDWVQRPAFLQAYPLTLGNAQFVNQLFDTAGLAGFAAERQAEIDAMNTQGRTRAQVLRNVIELPAFKQREYNPAFVLMQYFGYLRRDIDQAGYDFWLDVVTNREPGNYHGMVCAFITAAEYQLRFGTSVTRSNQDCAAGSAPGGN